MTSNVFSLSPVRDVVVTNDRWGKETSCKHGGFLSCDDRHNPSKFFSFDGNDYFYSLFMSIRSVPCETYWSLMTDGEKIHCANMEVSSLVKIDSYLVSKN